MTFTFPEEFIQFNFHRCHCACLLLLFKHQPNYSYWVLFKSSEKAKISAKPSSSCHLMQFPILQALYLSHFLLPGNRPLIILIPATKNARKPVEFWCASVPSSARSVSSWGKGLIHITLGTGKLNKSSLELRWLASKKKGSNFIKELFHYNTTSIMK